MNNVTSSQRLIIVVLIVIKAAGLTLQLLQVLLRHHAGPGCRVQDYNVSDDCSTAGLYYRVEY